MTPDPMIIQPPIRNASLTAAAVYAHSGEFAPTYTDLRLRGRGIHVAFDRTYRSSLADRIGRLGRGWTAGIDRRVEVVGDDLAYHDGTGREHMFRRGPAPGYVSPPGFYGVVQESRAGVVIRQRFGRTARFDTPADGGRLRALEDRNHNVVTFEYALDLITIQDTLLRQILVTITRGLITHVTDHAARRWTYVYDGDDRLVEVVRPATAAFPDGTSVRYAYGEDHRITSITDARGLTYLENHYDDQGRVVTQRYGDGAFELDYEVVGGDNPQAGVRTTCRRPSGASVVLVHDARGHLISRTVEVRRTAFSPDDVAGAEGSRMPLVTTFVVNRHSEVVERTDPAGNSTAWTYSSDDPDPLNQGNLLRVTKYPQPDNPGDQPSLVTTVEVERAFQAPVAVTDARGNTTRHRYDRRGNRIATIYPPVTVQPVDGDGPRSASITLAAEQTFAVNGQGLLLHTIEIDGTITAYAYYPESDPIGAAGPGTVTDDPGARCGHLARVTRDATGRPYSTGYVYDRFGNLAQVLDSSGNGTQLSWNAVGRLERVRGRDPSGQTIRYSYDADGNQTASVQEFTRLVYDEATGVTTSELTTLSELREYDALDNLIGRTIVGGDTRVIERFVRDADERVVRHLQPAGNATQYIYDERDLLVEKISGAGTPDACTERFTYTRNGALRSRTDARGATTMHTYDGFHRYTGFRDPLGTTKTQRLDEAGNVVRVTIDGPPEAPAGPQDDHDGAVRLAETAYRYDEWNRLFRVDRTWQDQNGQSLGRTTWDGTPGLVTTIVEFGTDGRPAALWIEGGNVARLKWDGTGRVVGVRDLTGEECSLDYDDNGNITELAYRGAASGGSRFAWTTRARYDEMDRLVWRQANDDPPETFRYDEFGAVVDHIYPSGLRIEQLHDELGRRVGQVLTIQDAIADPEVERIMRRFEYDVNFRLKAYVDGAGNRTAYEYDALDRQVSVVHADGGVARAEYDGTGNIIRIVDQNGTETINRYDLAGRLVERRSRSADAGTITVERFEHDGVGRLVGAATGSGAIRWTHDSLSRPLTEEHAGRVLRATYDPAGNPTVLAYPGGEEVRRKYDLRGRVVAVETAAGERIAQVEYRFGPQVARLVLGDALVANCRYDPRERLESIEYRHLDNGRLLEGFRYRYDPAGMPMEAVRTTAAGTSGERYRFDTAGRARYVRYGIADVSDPDGKREGETYYDYLPEGLWARRIDLDSAGRILRDRSGSVDEYNRYRKFGDVDFSNDATGNTVRESSAADLCLYTYDGEHRLVTVECFDAAGQRTQLITYVYDALGRQVGSTVTDGAGKTTQYSYVWAGSALIEEYENGVLLRTYFHGVGSLPAVLRVEQNGDLHHLYVHDGRGLASGLVRSDDLNAFAEKYGYEVTGWGYVTEIAGVSVRLSDRRSTRSGLTNSILSGGSGVLQDWRNGTMSGLGGRHLDPRLAAVLNSESRLTGKAHIGVRDVLSEQFGRTLTMLGLGGSGQVPTVTHESQPGGNIAAYKAGRGGGGSVATEPSNPVFDFSGRTPNASSKSPIREILDTPIRVGPPGGLETTVGGLIGGLLGGIHPKDHASEAPPAGSPSPSPPNEAEENAKEAADKQKREQEEKDKREQEAADKVDKENKDKKKETEEANKKKSIVEDGDKYPNPDGSANVSVTFPTAAQVETMLNTRKHPVNPNDTGPVTLDLASPPPRHGGLDPTIAYFDGDAPVGVWAGSTEPRLIIAPIDFEQGHEPPAFSDPSPGGGAGLDPREYRP